MLRNGRVAFTQWPASRERNRRREELRASAGSRYWQSSRIRRPFGLQDAMQLAHVRDAVLEMLDALDRNAASNDPSANGKRALRFTS